MSFDIIGMDPIYPNKHSEVLVDLNNKKIKKLLEGSKTVKLSEKDRKKYCELTDDNTKHNPGDSFRCNNWTWRPIHGLLSMVITKHNLPLKYWMWGDNSGNGIKSLEMKKLELQRIDDDEDVTIGEKDERVKYLKEANDFVKDPHTTCQQLGLLLEEELSGMVDTIYLNTGTWVHESGKFASQEELKDFANSIKKTNENLLLPGPITPDFSATNKIVKKTKSLKIYVKKKEGPKMLYPAHSCPVVVAQQFAEFLKCCGGFQVY